MKVPRQNANLHYFAKTIIVDFLLLKLREYADCVTRYTRVMIVLKGTISTPGPFCGLIRENPQWPGVLGWFSKHKILLCNFLVDLKVQSTTCEKNRWVGFPKIFEFKK
jgi:hypothetical protein